MIYETAIGDAYGIAWEFTFDQKGENDLSGYYANPRYPEHPAGHYTDDTLRSIANASVVLGDSERWHDPKAYIEAYQQVYITDNRKAWSRKFQAHLEAHKHSDPLDFMLSLRRRATNGAVMGIAVLGYLPDENHVRLAAAAQCISTHSGATVPAGQAIALAAHYLIYNKGSEQDLLKYLEEEVDWTDTAEKSKILCEKVIPSPEMPAWTIAAGAIAIVTDDLFTGMSDRLQFAVSRPGDTDSLAAVTMALCSCSKHIKNDLPETLTESLEDEAGRGMLKEIDRNLKEFAVLL